MSKIKEHCGCDKGHPEIKPVPVVKTIKKIVKQARLNEAKMKKYDTKWKRLSGTEEHDEVGYQLAAHKQGHAKFSEPVHSALSRLSDPKVYADALAKSNREVYTQQKVKNRNVQNTDASKDWNQTKKEIVKRSEGKEKGKVNRAEAGRGGIQKSPVVLRTQGQEHLLSGNTRLSANKRTKVHVLDMDKYK